MKKILALGKYSFNGEVLGSGNFGRVELATHVLTNVKVAIKIIDTRKLNTRYASKNLTREARILGQVKHPHIVKMYETLKASYLYCLVLEYVPNKDLEIYLNSLPQRRMSEVGSWMMVRQLTSALVYLHGHNIVHRDLKMNNILLDEGNENLKIIDFGLSNTFAAGELLKTHCGSPEYAAPELFYDRHDYGPEVDAWSFGVIVYRMLVGCLPFVPGSTEPSKRHALLKMLNKGLTIRHKSEMAHLSVDCRTLLFQLVEPKPNLRLGMFKVAAHSWITREGREPVVLHVEETVDKPLRSKVISKLAELHKVGPDQLTKHINEHKFDGLASQYNMLMDRYSFLRRVNKISVPSQKTCRRTRSAQPQSSPIGCKRVSSPPTRMKAMLDSKVKDDIFIGTTCANMIRYSGFSQRQKGSITKPAITVSGVAAGTQGAEAKGSDECQPEEGRVSIELGESSELQQHQTKLGADNSCRQTSNSTTMLTLSSTSTTLLGREDSQCSVDVNTLARPLHYKWASAGESSENEDLSHSTSRTLLMRSPVTCEQPNYRQQAVNSAMMADSVEEDSLLTAERGNSAASVKDEARGKRTRFRD